MLNEKIDLDQWDKETSVTALPFKLNNKLFESYLNTFVFTDEELAPQESNLYSDIQLEDFFFLYPK